MSSACLPRHPAVAYLCLVRPMNRSIILAGVVISAAILLNGYFDRAARAPHAAQPPEKQPPRPGESSIGLQTREDLWSEQNTNLAYGTQQEIIKSLTKCQELTIVIVQVVKGFQPAACHVWG